MFKDTQAISSFAVDDLDRAREFYDGTLGLDTEVMFAGEAIFLKVAGGRDTLVYRKPDFVPATYTILNFAVDDVEAAVDALVEKGVEMERYDGFDQDEKGISRTEGGPTGAWFKDPAGNILAVMKPPS